MDLRFPDQISYGASSTPFFNTEVVQVASGSEKRNALWSTPLYKFEASHGVKTQEQFNELLNFFMEKAKGRTNPFRFKNWAEHEINFDNCFISRPKTNILKLWKKYNTYNRRITKIVDGSFKLFANNLEIKTGFELDINTGLITLANPSIYDEKTIFTYICEFDFWVRFDTDEMYVSMDWYNIYTWNQIPMIEIREPDLL